MAGKANNEKRNHYSMPSLAQPSEQLIQLKVPNYLFPRIFTKIGKKNGQFRMHSEAQHSEQLIQL